MSIDTGSDAKNCLVLQFTINSQHFFLSFLKRRREHSTQEQEKRGINCVKVYLGMKAHEKHCASIAQHPNFLPFSRLLKPSTRTSFHQRNQCIKLRNMGFYIGVIPSFLSINQMMDVCPKCLARSAVSEGFFCIGLGASAFGVFASNA